RSLAHRVVNPTPVARGAEVEDLAAIDLIHELVFRFALNAAQQTLHLRLDVADQVLLSDPRRRGVGDGDDPDDVEVPVAGRQGQAAAGTGEHGEGLSSRTPRRWWRRPAPGRRTWWPGRTSPSRRACGATGSWRSVPRWRRAGGRSRWHRRAY